MWPKSISETLTDSSTSLVLTEGALGVMNEALGRDVEADDVLTYTTAEDNDNLA